MKEHSSWKQSDEDKEYFDEMRRAPDILLQEKEKYIRIDGTKSIWCRLGIHKYKRMSYHVWAFDVCEREGCNKVKYVPPCPQ